VLYAVLSVAVMLIGAETCAPAQAVSNPQAASSPQSSPGAQSASTAPEFEVATIKPSGPFDPSHFGFRIYPTRATFWSYTVNRLVEHAYSVMPSQVVGKGWMDTDQFDIVATYPKGTNYGDVSKMLQALLKDRFKLALRIEKKESETYALVVGKSGAKLLPPPPDPPAVDPDAPLKPDEKFVGNGDHKSRVTKNKDGSSTLNMGARGTMTTRIDMATGSMHSEWSKISMEALAGMLASCTGRGGHKVVDETGLKGNYQAAWDCPMGFSIPKSQSGGEASDTMPSDPAGGGDVLAKSLDALGLKLEKRNAPTDVYVIDHVEKPSDN
jgi:uncharacterized protein (TIGR03435 family)